jgi:hypothetical protein
MYIQFKKKKSKNTAHTSTHTADLIMKQNRLLLGRPLLVTEYRTSMIRSTGKVGFDKIDISRLSPSCVCPTSEDTIYEVQFREIYLQKLLKFKQNYSLFPENRHLRGTTERLQLLEPGGSYSPGTDL